MHFAIPDLHVFNIVLAVISSVGIVGAIALAVFAPALAEAILSAFLNIMGRILNTRLGVGIIVGFGCLVAGELYGTHEANIICRGTIAAAEKRADAAADQRDTQQAAIRSTEDQDYITKLETLNKSNEDQINGYAQELAARKNAVCALSAPDLQRLR